MAAPHGDPVIDGGSDDPRDQIRMIGELVPPEEGLLVRFGYSVLGALEFPTSGEQHGSENRVFRGFVEAGELDRSLWFSHILLTHGTTH